ncbi:hypothetical protein BpHYR1_034032 [Brachionus plicatilis]|uniref:Uncharacterized protein n=1 Tax=Brachionus plicatilis TaxID=10195 RepID=A0A3M7PFD3_BRAPC|nr:hypothetical protein BpHYR1_034032 [Brachionus plicatilis]
MPREILKLKKKAEILINVCLKNHNKLFCFVRDQSTTQICFLNNILFEFILIVSQQKLELKFVMEYKLNK